MQTEMIEVLANQLFDIIKEKGITLATAESCTGGWIAEAITSVAGSSDIFDCGWVTYSNQAKQRCLGVDAKIVSEFGAVSAETAVAMAEGALKHSAATISVSTTGIAGPAGGSAEKPVGTVWFAWAKQNAPTQVEMKVLQGNRQEIRAAAVLHALNGIIQIEQQ